MQCAALVVIVTSFLAQPLGLDIAVKE